jgi:hypothetical protein
MLGAPAPVAHTWNLGNARRNTLVLALLVAGLAYTALHFINQIHGPDRR